MATTIMSIISSALSSVANSGVPGTSLGDSLPTSLGSPIPSEISSIASSISSIISSEIPTSPPAPGTTSFLPPTSLAPSTSTTPTSASTLPSSSPTSIPTTSSIFSSNSITPVVSTPASLLQSTSNSVSPTASLNIVTSVSGSSSTITSSLPTTLVNSPSADAVSRRTAAIAGATTGFIALLLIALAAVFLYRRHKLRKSLETSGKRREGRGLLDGEEFDDDERNISTSMRSYPYPTHVSNPQATSTLNLIKTRTSDTGSIFREEVWPPPGFIDPISKQSSQVDLSGIVDEVMGSSSNEPAGPSSGYPKPPQPTDTSTVSAISSTSTSSLITDRMYSSTSSRSTFDRRIPTSPSLSIPPSPPSARASLNTQPRKSSPLARPSISDPKLWLTRNVRQTALP